MHVIRVEVSERSYVKSALNMHYFTALTTLSLSGKIDFIDCILTVVIQTDRKYKRIEIHVL